MRVMKLLFAGLLALTIASCTNAQRGDLGGLLGGGVVVNPVSSVDIYRIKNVYGATLELVIKWREYCGIPAGAPAATRSYASLMADPIAKPVCTNRRGTLLKIQKVQAKAGAAIRYADDWVRQNPNVSATSVIGPAWDAVTAFQQIVPRVN